MTFTQKEYRSRVKSVVTRYTPHLCRDPSIGKARMIYTDVSDRTSGEAIFPPIIAIVDISDPHDAGLLLR